MSENKSLITIFADEYAALCAEAEDARLLKKWLGRKNQRYADVEHKEIDDLCVVFGIEGKENG